MCGGLAHPVYAFGDRLGRGFVLIDGKASIAVQM